jgi:hypothetical protein
MRRERLSGSLVRLITRTREKQINSLRIAGMGKKCLKCFKFEVPKVS